jgi:uncharacterized C2H2 Zn-finger protein
MEPAEIAWAAGLFEGEGCITVCWPNDNHHVLPLVRLAITMTDRDVLERFCQVVRCGSVGPERRYGREHHKPAYVWLVSSRAEVERLLLAFLPWFGARRTAKATETLAEIARLDRTCRLCGETFRAKRSDTFFCSTKHRNRWHYLKNRPAQSASVGRPRVAGEGYWHAMPEDEPLPGRGINLGRTPARL